MTGRNAAQDPIREEALDWLLRVEAAPDDAAVQSALQAWRRRNPAHERAWQSVAQVWRLAGDLPPGAAPAAPCRQNRMPGLTWASLAISAAG